MSAGNMSWSKLSNQGKAFLLFAERKAFMPSKEKYDH